MTASHKRESGIQAYKNKEKDKALSYLHEAVKLHPKDATSLRWIGRIYFDKKKYDLAERYLRDALDLDPQMWTAWNNLGWFYEKKKKYEEMVDAFKKAIQYSDNNKPWNHIGLARGYYYLKKYDMAKSKLEIALELGDVENPQGVSVLWLGFTSYKLKDKNKARSYFQDYLDKVKEKHVANTVIGEFYRKQHNYVLAEGYLEKAIGIDPEYWLAWANLGWLYERKKKYEEMVDAFEKAIQYSDSKRLWNLIGLARGYYYLKKYDMAKSKLEGALELGGTQEVRRQVKVYLAYIPTAKGDYKEAKKWLAKERYIGIYLIPDEEKRQLKVTNVCPGGIADLAGIKENDGIFMVNQKPITEAKDLIDVIQSTKLGESIDFMIRRNGKVLPYRVVMDFNHYLSKLKQKPLIAEPVAKKPAKIKKIVPPPKIGEYYAVVIGIGKYKDDRIPKLKYTTVDAESIYNILTDPQYGNFPENQVKLLINEQATYYSIKSAIGTWLRRNTRKDDTVIVFFAGHGAPEDEKTYWVTYNANIDDLYGTALSNDEIADMLDRVEAKKMIVFLDSCYSAATIHGTDKKRGLMIVKDPFQRFKGKGRVVITSSDGKEESVEIEKFGHGVFTYYLVKALKGEADENEDGFVDLDEVWDYVKYRVTDTARKHGSTQTPIIDGSYSAGIVLSKHPERLKKLHLEAERKKENIELEEKIAKLTELYSKGEITDSQFDKAIGILKSGQKNKLLDSFLSNKISLTTFKTVFK